MATNILTAVVTKVQFGTFEIDGLMFPDGSYGVAVPQADELFQFAKTQASRDIKAILGKDYQFDKYKTALHPKAVNVLLLADFEKLTFELAMNGHPVAQNFVRALYGLSLTQLFSDAFDVKFEAEDRQKWLETRFHTKHDFRPLTNQLKAHGFKESWEYGKFVHAMQSAIGLPDGTRDIADFKTLHLLEKVQDKLTAYMECGCTPYDALAKIAKTERIVNV